MSISTDTDILYEILKNFYSIYDYYKYSLVCKLWNEVSIETRLRESINDIQEITYNDECNVAYITIHDMYNNSYDKNMPLKIDMIKNKFPNIQLDLDLQECYDLVDISPFKQVSILNLAYCNNITDLTPLYIHALNSCYLDELSIEWCRSISDLTGLKGIKCLHINGCDQISDLTPIISDSLNNLYATSCTRLTSDSLIPLRNAKNLKYLCIRICERIDNIDGLRDFSLTTLNASYIFIKDISVLSSIKTLTELDISATMVSDLSPLKGLPLIKLGIDNCVLLRDLNALEEHHLQRLSMIECISIKGDYALLPLTNSIPTLKHLNTTKCVHITYDTLKVLKGLPLKVVNTNMNSILLKELKDMGIDPRTHIL